MQSRDPSAAPLLLSFILALLALASTGCASHSLEQRRTAAAPAVSALHDGSFERAGREADAQIGADSANPYARLVRAIVRYKRSMHQASLDVRTVVIGGIGAGAFNQKYLRTSLEQTESELAGVEEDLAAAASDPGIAIELCIACWEIDWNIVLTSRDIEVLERDSDTDAMMSALLGDHYLPSMRPSPLPGRLARMKGEIERREEGLERKLRYLFWLN